MISEKEYFKQQYEITEATKLVLAIKLPTGNTELIINTDNIDTKVEYILSAYDNDLYLKTNKQIQIVNYMFC